MDVTRALDQRGTSAAVRRPPRYPAMTGWPPGARGTRLTSRQQEVLALMAQGCSNAAIARRLFVTERAVIQHVSHIYDQLGLPVSEDDHRRVLAVLHYLER
jgi:DNA-binding NarL/FixJ family response regulator